MSRNQQSSQYLHQPPSVSPDLVPISPLNSRYVPPSSRGSTSESPNLTYTTSAGGGPGVGISRGNSIGVGGIGGGGLSAISGSDINEILGPVTSASIAAAAAASGPPPIEDQIPSVKPVIDSHDRLWAEDDVLDDAADLAHRVKSNGSFFGPAHSRALDKLRDAQIELAQMTAEAERKHDRSQYHILWEKSDLESLRKVLFDEAHFEQLSGHVDNTVAKLDEVAKFMKAVDEQSREFWSNLN